MDDGEDDASINRARGIRRLGDPRVWGTVIGAIGATVFVMENRGELTAPWPALAVAGWALAAAAYVTFVFVIPRAFGPVGDIGPRAGLVYLTSVAGMLLLIFLGSLALTHADASSLRPALIVLAVGLHFLPFASAFHTPMFTLLGSVMATLGATGLALGWAWDERAAPAAAVVAGIVMLTIIAGDAARSARLPSPLNVRRGIGA